ncbi:hypothetical protein [Aeromonas jandaei]|uniref:hypothetical protein n=1 Tax=Aeromonas jandaei TaxID=650 RepID=UPI003B9F0E40
MVLQFIYPITISFSSTVHTSLKNANNTVVVKGGKGKSRPDLGSSKYVQSKAGDTNDRVFESQAASLASETGNFIYNEDNSDAAKRRVISFGKNAANDAVNE